MGVQSGNIVFHDGFITRPTLGCEHVEVVVPTIWFSFTFMEAFFTELLAALGAEEVLHVPCLLQRGHAFLQHKKQKRNGAIIMAASNVRPR